MPGGFDTCTPWHRPFGARTGVPWRSVPGGVHGASVCPPQQAATQPPIQVFT
jgi:hypothetical protein